MDLVMQRSRGATFVWTSHSHAMEDQTLEVGVLSVVEE
jgi:hypothetical protein